MASSPSSTCATSGSSPKYISGIAENSTTSTVPRKTGSGKTTRSKDLSISTTWSNQEPASTFKSGGYSISRFQLDPVCSQPGFRFTSESQSVHINKSRASTVCSGFDKLFSSASDDKGSSAGN